MNCPNSLPLLPSHQLPALPTQDKGGQVTSHQLWAQSRENRGSIWRGKGFPGHGLRYGGMGSGEHTP